MSRDRGRREERMNGRIRVLLIMLVMIMMMMMIVVIQRGIGQQAGVSEGGKEGRGEGEEKDRGNREEIRVLNIHSTMLLSSPQPPKHPHPFPSSPHPLPSPFSPL